MVAYIGCEDGKKMDGKNKIKRQYWLDLVFKRKWHRRRSEQKKKRLSSVIVSRGRWWFLSLKWQFPQEDQICDEMEKMVSQCLPVLRMASVAPNHGNTDP